MLIAAIVLSFALASLAPVLHRMLGEKTGWLLAIFPASLTVYFATLARRVSAGERPRVSYAWAPGLDIHLSFYVDGLAVLFALIITGIGALVIVYAGGYLKGHHHLGRLYSHLLLFMGSMLGVVLSDNVIALFVFWELTSISSYLLIGYYHERGQARAAALQALLVTGLGGLGLLAGLVLLGQPAGAWELSEWLPRGPALREHSLYLPGLLLVLLGAFTKSAQVPFHFWLPDAMEAPAPVSAYLHAATMVKAGVYLLARLSPILGGTAEWLWLVAGVGLATMVYGAYMATRQTKMKRILAYSTVSGLGILVFLLGVGSNVAINAFVVYLVAHACYKGALFLAAGTVDHETGESDIRRLGGMRRKMPFTALAALLAAGSMAGLPPLVGFIGKELYLEAAWSSWLFPYLMTAAATLTAMLLGAAALMTAYRPFFGNVPANAPDVHEGGSGLLLGPGLLALLGLAVGLAPWLAERWLLSAAADAVAGGPISMDLALWHGVNVPLLLGVAALAGGVGIYTWRARRYDSAAEGAIPAPGSAPGYAASLRALNAAAKAQTRFLQSGYLRYYLLIIVSTAVGLAGYTFWTRARLPPLENLGEFPVHETILTGVMLAASLAAAVTRSRLAAFMAIGVVGYGVGLIFLLHGAPDLAMTQFVVETLMVILFVLAFYRLPQFGSLSNRATRVRDAVVAGAAGSVVGVLVFAALGAQIQVPISHYFVENSYPAGHGRNIVNVVLVDFRALDTLGEITVLAIAGIGVYALIRLRPTAEKK